MIKLTPTLKQSEMKEYKKIIKFCDECHYFSEEWDNDDILNFYCEKEYPSCKRISVAKQEKRNGIMVSVNTEVPIPLWCKLDNQNQ